MAAGPVPETPYDRSMTGSGGSAPLVELDGLTVRLGGRTVLDAVTARLDGRAVGLLGPNGAGKTTLIRTLLGFHRPAAGKAAVLGLPVGSGAALARRIGYMPEHEAFIAGMTGVRLVRMLAELSGLDRREALERAHEALVWAGLGEARYRTVETYSAGMRQLLKLAQAVVHRPQLLILDEPTNALDPPARRRMLELVEHLRDTEGVRVLLSSHMLPDVERLCDQVMILREGRPAAVLDLAAERREARGLWVVEVSGDEAAFATAAAAVGFGVARSGRRLRVTAAGGPGPAELFAAADRTGTAVVRLEARRDSLRDIYLEAMGELP